MTTYNYDAQIRRFLTQIIRILSNFQVKFGDGVLYRVPVIYGDSSRQAASILRRNSENSIPPTPLISVYITDFKYSRERVQDPTFVDRAAIRTRKYDPVTDSYLREQGNAFMVERLMPVPYDLTVKADVWTSNSDQKLQLMEQILSVFNPALEIQSTDNYLDWGSLSYMEQTNINWSSRSVPQGTDDQIDIASIDFAVPIWISTPARVKKQGVIHKIITSYYDPQSDLSEYVSGDGILLGTRQAVTFQNYGVWVNDGQIQLLKQNPVVPPNNIDTATQVVIGETVEWASAIEKYGVLRDGISQLRLIQDFENQIEIVGTITVHPTDPKILLYNVDTDTLPLNTLEPVNAIIDPQRVYPGFNGLPSAAANQRYLLLKDIGNSGDNESASGWTFNGIETKAQANDIIEFNGVSWNVIFDSQTTTTQYVSNLTTGRQYKFQNSRWVKSWEGQYDALNWRLVL